MVSATLKNQWTKLQIYLTDGRINIDNNREERAIKPFVIGRKAWLFANTHGGADASAVLYSLVETAKANDLQPIDYLMSLFEQWAHIKDSDDRPSTALEHRAHALASIILAG